MSTLKMAKKKCVEEDYDDEYDEEDEDDLATDEGKGPARGLCYSPSLNTQFCIKGLLVVLDFCFWASTIKKKLAADYEQLLRAVFSCCQGQKRN